MPLASTYSVSKAAVHSITQGMRGELANDNVLVMGVYPGPIDTDMAAGVEVAVGMKNDAQFGPLVVIACGGVLIELLAERISR